jgi:hypothetical protein
VASAEDHRGSLLVQAHQPEVGLSMGKAFLTAECAEQKEQYLALLPVLKCGIEVGLLLHDD